MVTYEFTSDQSGVYNLGRGGMIVDIHSLLPPKWRKFRCTFVGMIPRMKELSEMCIHELEATVASRT
jgi:hypothetical protein